MFRLQQTKGGEIIIFSDLLVEVTTGHNIRKTWNNKTFSGPIRKLRTQHSGKLTVTQSEGATKKLHARSYATGLSLRLPAVHLTSRPV